MSPGAIETTWLVVGVAAACALPGVFLVLRRMALVGDAISHVLLFGIVLAYFVVGDLNSPWLAVGAVASGVLTVALVEFLQKSRRLHNDAAIGLVFPGLFAIGTLLASIHFRGTHLDIDAVLLGHAELVIWTEPIFAYGIYLGRLPTVIMFTLFIVQLGLFTLLYKELKLCTFDPALAATFGFLPGLVHYGFMTLVSLTTVAAFDAVGPVLVVAFLVVPAATALLLTDRLPWILVLSVLLAVFSAVVGVRVAFAFKTNTAGTVATMLGVVFAFAFILSPGRGLLARGLRRLRQRREFFLTMLTIHLLQHEGTPAEADEARVDGLHRHFHWSPQEVEGVVRRALAVGLVSRAEPLLRLTEAGRERARNLLQIR